MSSKNQMQSPRAKAHTLKATGSSKKLRKKGSNRNFNPYTDGSPMRDDISDSGSMRSGLGLDRSITGLAEERSMESMMRAVNSQDTVQLQVQLAKAMDDTSILRSRLRSELEHRQILEAKISDLTEKLGDSKKGLQDTKLALNKVQAVASQLITKRDERELQLQSALDQNTIYERKIAELEIHITQLTSISGTSSNVSTSMQKVISEHVERNRSMEDDLLQLRAQLSAAKREIIRITEEKVDAEYLLEAKKKRITFLEEHMKSMELSMPTSELMQSTRDSFLMSVLDMSRQNTAAANGNNAGNSSPLRQSIANAAAIAAASNSTQPLMANTSPTHHSQHQGHGQQQQNQMNQIPFAGTLTGSASSSLLEQNVERITKKVAEMTHMENKLVNLEGKKRLLHDRLALLEKQYLDSQRMAIEQQQKQFEQQTVLQQQLQQIQAQNLNAFASFSINNNNQNSNQNNANNNNNHNNNSNNNNNANNNATNSANNNSSSIGVRQGQVAAVPPPSNMVDGLLGTTPMNGGNRPGSSSSSSAANKQPLIPTVTMKDEDAQLLLREILSANSMKRPTSTAANKKPSSSSGSRSRVGTAPTAAVPVEQPVAVQAAPVPAPAPVVVAAPVVVPAPVAPAPVAPALVAPAAAAAAPSKKSRKTVRSSASASNSPAPAAAAAQPSVSFAQDAKPGDGNGERAIESTVSRSAPAAPAAAASSNSIMTPELIEATGTDNLEKAKKKIVEEKKQIKKTIMEWAKKFQEENGREPTKTEREMYAGSLYKRYRQKAKLLKQLGGGGESNKKGKDDEEDH